MNKSKSQKAREMAARLTKELKRSPTNREVVTALSAEGVEMQIEHVNNARYWGLKKYQQGDRATQQRCIHLLERLLEAIGSTLQEIKATMEVEDCGNIKAHCTGRAIDAAVAHNKQDNCA